MKSTTAPDRDVGSSDSSAVWLLFGGYDYEGDRVIACCATEAEAQALKAYGEESGYLRYGYHYLRVISMEVGYREDGVPVLPNVLDEPRGRNADKLTP